MDRLSFFIFYLVELLDLGKPIFTIGLQEEEIQGISS